MANEEKARSEGKVVADPKMLRYVKIDELDEKGINEQFNAYHCDLKCSTAKRDSSTKIIRATVTVAPGLELVIRDLSLAEYSLILLERKVAQAYQGMAIHFPCMVRFVKGPYKDSEDCYEMVEIKLSKSVFKSMFLDYAQKKLIEIAPNLSKAVKFVWNDKAISNDADGAESKEKLAGELFN